MRSLTPLRLWYLHSLPHAKGCNRVLRKSCKNTTQARKGRKDSNENKHIHLHINVLGPLRPSQRKSQVLTTLLHGPSCPGLAHRPSSSAGGTTSTSKSFARRPTSSSRGLDQVQAGRFILFVSPVWIRDEVIRNEAHAILKPRPDDRHGPLHAMM
jgi:hypothetical protein